jgi:hypothetical protein
MTLGSSMVNCVSFEWSMVILDIFKGGPLELEGGP